MFGFNVRWTCSRLRQARKFFILILVVLLILLLLNLIEDDSKTSSIDSQHPSGKVHHNSSPGGHLHGDHERSKSKGVDDERTRTQSDSRKPSNLTEIPTTDQKNVSDSKSNFTKARGNLRKIFGYKLTAQEKAIVFQILQVLEEVSEKYNLPYFLCGGTLLGSYRHHDLIPWDDDIDVYMNLTQRDEIFTVLNTLSPTFEVFSAGNRLKLYSHLSHPSSKFPWDFPYVDINFFKENATHIIDSDPLFQRMAYPKETIFPPHRRPLSGLWLYSPHDTYSYLMITYQNLAMCSTSHYDHRTETILGNGGVVWTPCRKLKDAYPFVYRSVDPDPTSRGVRETLKMADTELRTVTVDELRNIIGDVFHLNTQSASTGTKQRPNPRTVT